MDRCRRRLNSSLVSLSFACMRSRRVFLLRRNLPRRDVPQMSVKPRKLKVSGLPSPRRARLCAAKRPNAIKRVFSEWSVRTNASNLARIISRNRRASVSRSNPITITRDDHVAGGLAPSPALRPEIKDVVQIDVGEPSDTAGSPHTQADDVEVGGQRGRESLDRLRNVVGRVEVASCERRGGLR